MNLKKIRTERGLSQSDVAESIGCSANVYSRYEREERQPSIETLLLLSDFFNVSVDYILGRPNDKPILAEHEYNFLQAYRRADDRARLDAYLLLTRHKK